MVISAPRSGSTWASNWLTTEKSLCIHDPIINYKYDEIDLIKSNKKLGVSCTALALADGFLNNHKSRKVILHRDIKEINKSLCSIGMTSLENSWDGVLEKIKGIHAEWTDIFNNPKYIYEYLLELPFDEERHKILKEIHMQPFFEQIEINKEAIKKFMMEIVDCRG